MPRLLQFVAGILVGLNLGALAAWHYTTVHWEKHLVARDHGTYRTYVDRGDVFQVFELYEMKRK